jgi:hypothetical protein
MAELSIMDILLIVLALLFVGIAFGIRRLRFRMEADLRKSTIPLVGLRHMYKKIDYGKKRK